MHLRHIQAQPPGQAHHKPFVDHGMRVVRVRVIWLEDVGGGRSARRFKQCAIFQNNSQLVLRTGQRHALDGSMRQR